MGSRSDGWGESSCEWEDASAWLRSGGSPSGFSSRLAASEALRSGGLADRTNAPSPAPREGRDALTPEQRAILEQRGVLSPAEIHHLASKIRAGVGADKGHKAACHSDVADDGEAKRIQTEKVVRLPVQSSP